MTFVRLCEGMLPSFHWREKCILLSYNDELGLLVLEPFVGFLGMHVLPVRSVGCVHSTKYEEIPQCTRVKVEEARILMHSTPQKNLCGEERGKKWLLYFCSIKFRERENLAKNDKTWACSGCCCHALSRRRGGSYSPPPPSVKGKRVVRRILIS